MGPAHLNERLQYRILELRLSNVERNRRHKEKVQQKEMSRIAGLIQGANYWAPSDFCSGKYTLTPCLVLSIF